MNNTLRFGAIAPGLLVGADAAHTPEAEALGNGTVAWLQFSEQAVARVYEASGSGRSGQYGGRWHPEEHIKQAVHLNTGTVDNMTRVVGGNLNSGDAWISFLFHAS